MKKIFIVLLSLCSYFSYSQTAPDVDKIKLEIASDYISAEPFVLQASNYILSSPFEKDNLSRLKSLSFIIKWMSGTPDYGFTLDNVSNKLGKSNDDLLGLYMVCMAKFCLENKGVAKDENKLKMGSVSLLLDYCSNESNKIKMNKQLKKLAEARDKGELEKEL